MFGQFLLEALPLRLLGFPAQGDGVVTGRSICHVQAQSHEGSDFTPAPIRGQAAKFLGPGPRLRRRIGES